MAIPHAVIPSLKALPEHVETRPGNLKNPLLVLWGLLFPHLGASHTGASNHSEHLCKLVASDIQRFLCISKPFRA